MTTLQAHLTPLQTLSPNESDFPPGSSYQVWELSPQMVKAVIKAIMCGRQDPECLLEAPSAPQKRSPNFAVDKVGWSCMPTSNPSCVKYAAYRKADDEVVRADYHASWIPSGLDWLKVTYGNLRHPLHFK